MLAARDVIFKHWIEHPRPHSPYGTLGLAFLCNIIGILDLRLISIFKINPKAQVLLPLPRRVFEVLTRPRRPLDPCQVEATAGHKPDNHYVYLMLAQANGYVGRTGGCRATGPTQLDGLTPRWSEHVRELEQHRNGTISKARRRRRYDELKHGIWNSCLNYVVFHACSSSEIAGQEAVAITLAQTRANGHELKSFVVRRTRNRRRENGPRIRPSGASRRNAKRACIRNALGQWGSEVSVHGRSLSAAHKDNLLKAYAAYAHRNASSRTLKSQFSVSFKEFYQREQAVVGLPGPYLSTTQSSLYYLSRDARIIEYAKCYAWRNYFKPIEHRLIMHTT